MTHNEFAAWGAFYRANPFDDLHRYHRPAALVSATFGDGDTGKRLDWLAPSQSSTGFTPEESETIEQRGLSAADVATMRGLGVRPGTVN